MQRGEDEAGVVPRSSAFDVRRRFEILAPHLDERTRRLWAGTEALVLGAGGAQRVAAASGLARSTVVTGMKEARGELGTSEVRRVRRRGGGRKPIEQAQPGIQAALQALMSLHGDDHSTSALSWTCKGTRELSGALRAGGFRVSQHKISELLGALGYRLQLVRMSAEVVRACESDLIDLAQKVEGLLSEGQPVVSVTIGLETGNGVPQVKRGEPGATPCAHEEPGVSSAIAFALQTWWSNGGCRRFPSARDLLVVIAGSRQIRVSLGQGGALERFAADAGLRIQLRSLPPATTRWTRVLETFRLATRFKAQDRSEVSLDIIGALIGAPVPSGPIGH